MPRWKSHPLASAVTRRRYASDVTCSGGKVMASLATVLALIWIHLLWTTFGSATRARVVDSVQYSRPIDCNPDSSYSQQRFIIFLRPLGQGVGNSMSGLLATHMLGMEFNRTVCVHPSYESFYTAFRPRDESCGRLFACERPSLTEKIRLLNFGDQQDECHLQKLLASSKRILWVEANTYPRWTSIPDSLRFADHYHLQPALLDILPWKVLPPRQVVHLRVPDDGTDIRKGLDETSLKNLGERLPSTTYLVTNKVQLFDWFAERYGWAHPPWKGVSHSSLAISWGDRRGRDIPRIARTREAERTGDLQLWADWYTISQCQVLIHTHSEFSSSAAYWMKIKDSRIFDGVDPETGKLCLRPEELHRHNPAAPLSRRQRNASIPDLNRLKNC